MVNFIFYTDKKKLTMSFVPTGVDCHFQQCILYQKRAMETKTKDLSLYTPIILER